MKCEKPAREKEAQPLPYEPTINPGQSVFPLKQVASEMEITESHGNAASHEPFTGADRINSE